MAWQWTVCLGSIMLSDGLSEVQYIKNSPLACQWRPEIAVYVKLDTRWLLWVFSVILRLILIFCWSSYVKIVYQILQSSFHSAFCVITIRKWNIRTLTLKYLDKISWRHLLNILSGISIPTQNPILPPNKSY